MLKITDLEKIYRTEDIETMALNKISVEVKNGEFVAIMGPSGCGKSTLLNIVGLLDDADTGSFKFNNEEVISYNERKRADLRKRNIGFVFQSFNLIDELTVYENVELPLLYLGIDADERKKRVEAVLEKVQIMHRGVP
jgi:putative ABC transport system ATP-binding protein